MVRVNLVHPRKLTDEHLYAENVELKMLETFINEHPKGFIPDEYCLGKGHMSFFRNKIGYIKYRQHLISREMCSRKGTPYVRTHKLYPIEWEPDDKDISVNKARIINRLVNPLKKKNPWHYKGKEIIDIDRFVWENYHTILYGLVRG